MSRSDRVLDRPEEEQVALLQYPTQVYAEQIITSLLTDLRAISDPGDYFEFQRVLIHHLYDVDEQRSEAARNVKREARGKTVPDGRLPWPTSLAMWDRIGRQLRSVGDALAWRIYNFDRRYILALSRNQAAGPLVGKDGLAVELGAVEEAWKNDREFVLLHDITNCLRICDATFVTVDGPRIAEIKTSTASGSRARTQLKRAEQAIRVVNDGDPLDGTIALVNSERTLRTDLATVNALLTQTLTDGIRFDSIAPGQVLSSLAVISGPRADESEVAILVDRLRRTANTDAGIDEATHLMSAQRVDSLGRGTGTAPFTIFPVEPALAAALTTDRLILGHVVSFERVAEVLDSHGFDVQCLLPEADGPVPDSVARLRDRRTNAVARLDSGFLDRLFYEFIDLELLVEVVAEQIRQDAPEGQDILMLLKDEEQIWK